MKQQKSKANKKSTHSKKKTKPIDEPYSWVDEHLDWMAVESNEKNDSSSGVSIVCWNVLADAYCNYKSHQHLPLKFQRHVFDRHQRQHHVRQILRRFASTIAPDFLALQEVDPPLEVAGCMKELGYEGIETPSSPGGKDGRVDACALYYRHDQWKCLEHEIVRLDDLATMCSKESKEKPSVAGSSNLQDVQTSFVRKNMALLVRLEHLHGNRRQLVVAVLHLYWNPSYEYVKVRSRDLWIVPYAIAVCF
jgi:mRNA deadenylase 3'-5' endonuclease subunit Ccr4